MCNKKDNSPLQRIDQEPEAYFTTDSGGWKAGFKLNKLVLPNGFTLEGLEGSIEGNKEDGFVPQKCDFWGNVVASLLEKFGDNTNDLIRSVADAIKANTERSDKRYEDDHAKSEAEIEEIHARTEAQKAEAEQTAAATRSLIAKIKEKLS